MACWPALIKLFEITEYTEYSIFLFYLLLLSCCDLSLTLQLTTCHILAKTVCNSCFAILTHLLFLTIKDDNNSNNNNNNNNDDDDGDDDDDDDDDDDNDDVDNDFNNDNERIYQTKYPMFNVSHY